MDFLCFSLGVTSGARAVTAVSSSITLGGGEGSQVRLANLGPSPVAVFASLGAGTAVFPVDAATCNGKGQVMLSGAVESFTIPAGTDTLNFICAAAQTATMFVGRGKGS